MRVGVDKARNDRSPTGIERCPRLRARGQLVIRPHGDDTAVADGNGAPSQDAELAHSRSSPGACGPRKRCQLTDVVDEQVRVHEDLRLQ
jgi:hypothetical protein